MNRPQPILASKLWLHLDPRLHNTPAVISSGIVYTNVGGGWVEDREAEPEDYEAIPEVVKELPVEA